MKEIAVEKRAQATYQKQRSGYRAGNTSSELAATLGSWSAEIDMKGALVISWAAEIGPDRKCSKHLRDSMVRFSAE